MIAHSVRSYTRRTQWARRIDPRVLFSFILVMNLVGFSVSHRSIVAICLLLVAVFLIVSASWRTVFIWCGFAGINLLIFYTISMLSHSVWAASLTLISFWMLRFCIPVGATIGVFSVLDPHRLSAVLGHMRAPVWFSVTAQVIVRFFPVAIAEIKAIHNAMILRNLNPGARGLLLHPLKVGEYLLIPLLASSARIADELTAAATLRGVGADTRRTSIVNPRLTYSDIAVFTLLIAIVLWWLWGLLT